jgi:hypothetical protein
MVNVLGLLATSLLAVGKKPTTWFIDGNNLLAHKGTTKDRDALADRLKPIESAESVVLVFDGRPGDVSINEKHEGNFRLVELPEGVSSDDFILKEIRDIVATSKVRRIEVVTADRQLRRLALESRPNVRGVVNPITFWKKYLPRMAGLKKVDETVESNAL